MFLGVTLVDGGSERFESVAKALEVVKPEAEFIAVHDSVRPCTQSEHVDRVFEAAKRFGAALLGVPVADTLKKAGEGQKVVQTIPRKNLWHAQTPQVARPIGCATPTPKGKNSRRRSPMTPNCSKPLANRWFLWRAVLET